MSCLSNAALTKYMSWYHNITCCNKTFFKMIKSTSRNYQYREKSMYLLDKIELLLKENNENFY